MVSSPEVTNGNDVKAAILPGDSFLGQIIGGYPDHLMALPRSDRKLRRAISIRGWGSRFDLNEGQYLSFPCDEIDLSQRAAVISLQDLIALFH